MLSRSGLLTPMDQTRHTHGFYPTAVGPHSIWFLVQFSYQYLESGRVHEIPHLLLLLKNQVWQKTSPAFLRGDNQ